MRRREFIATVMAGWALASPLAYAQSSTPIIVQTAKRLGLEVPTSLQLLADEVIE